MNLKTQAALEWCTDACSRCHWINKPVSTWNGKSKGYIRADYICGKCRHEWFTSWELQFALEHSADSKYLAEQSLNA